MSKRRAFFCRCVFAVDLGDLETQDLGVELLYSAAVVLLLRVYLLGFLHDISHTGVDPADAIQNFVGDLRDVGSPPSGFRRYLF